MTRRPPRRPPREPGFSLVELAVVLVIVGLLIGGLMTPISMQIEQQRANDTRRTLELAREALLGFALRNGYLPCPAVSATDGLEDRAGGNCRPGKRAGYLPWATLGVPRADGWGHLLRYSVTPAFADSVRLFGLGTPRDITIGTRDARGNVVAASAINDVPAVVLSHGRNGWGATSEQGILSAATASGNADERTNARGAIAFIDRPPSAANAPGGEFDDLVAWLSPNVLFSRMVAAGTLPH
jgi:prepilin-type N-terminal cleavage/methylation domain-containing protein